MYKTFCSCPVFVQFVLKWKLEVRPVTWNIGTHVQNLKKFEKLTENSKDLRKLEIFKAWQVNTATHYKVGTP